MAATALASKISLSDITECSICLETWRDPRSLPTCDHTFCLQCLKTFVQKLDEDVEDTKCPVCRKEFAIPEGGLDLLPKNFMHQQLLDARRVSGAIVASVVHEPHEETPMCDLCVFNIPASGYCVECDQNICQTCTMSHSRARASLNHKVVGLEDKKKPFLIKKLRSSYCQQHREEQVKLYCGDCQKSLCAICHATQHVGHKCAAINDAAQVFVDRVKRCHVSVEGGITKTEGYLGQINKNRNEFLEMVSDKEKQIQKKEHESINLIKSEHAQILNELKQIKEKQLKEINMKEEEIDTQLVALKGFLKTSKELLDYGSASDICRSSNDLLAQADVLVDPQTECTLICNLDKIDISFIPAIKPDVNGCEVRLVGLIHHTDITDVDKANSSSQNPKAVTLDQVLTSLEKDVKEKNNKISSLEKDVKEKDTKILNLETQLKQAEEKFWKLNEAIDPVRSTLFLSKSSEVNVIPGTNKGAVYAIAVIRSELFIARHGQTSVEVYDTNNITATPFLLRISDQTLNAPRLAACSHYNCLYVRHWSNITEPLIYRVELSNSSVSNWAVEGMAWSSGLSLTNNYNLLVTVSHKRKVQEYMTHGELIREISFDRSIECPSHCIQLSDDNFVVSHVGSTQHRICIVDASGQIIKSYGGFPGLGVGQLNEPRQLSVDKYDLVFVTDCDNNRIQLLSPTLTLLGTVQIPGLDLSSPNALFFSNINHQLYIDGGSGSVLVVQLSVAQK